jgi:hypothetical protein
MLPIVEWLLPPHWKSPPIASLGQCIASWHLPWGLQLGGHQGLALLPPLPSRMPQCDCWTKKGSLHWIQIVYFQATSKTKAISGKWKNKMKPRNALGHSLVPNGPVNLSPIAGSWQFGPFSWLIFWTLSWQWNHGEASSGAQQTAWLCLWTTHHRN